MKNNKGFSLVELLVVIVLVGVLSGLAIVGISTYMDNSRKDAYLAAVRAQVEGIKLLINSEEYYVFDDNTTYYFDFRLLKETDDIKSPYGEWKNAYVVVTYTNNNLHYYWTGIDDKGWRIDLNKQVKDMNRSDIYNKAGNVAPGNPVENKEKIGEYSVGKETDKDTSAYNNMTSEEASECYTFEMGTDETYKITGYKEECGPNVNVPSSIDGSIVSSIGMGAFREKKIKTVILYDGLTNIELGAFQKNNINSLKLPTTLVTIEDYAFYQNQIPEVTFSEGLEVIGAWSFADNKLRKVDLPKSVRTIGSYAFYGNLIEEIEFHSNPTLGGAAFSKNKVPSENGILYKYDEEKQEMDYTTIIGYCSEEKDVVIPAEKNGVAPKIVKTDAFASTGITSVDMPDSIETLETDAFAFNSITSVKMSQGLKTIGTGAFRSNYLTSIDIPASVTKMGNYPFVNNNIKDDDGNCRIFYNRNSKGVDYTTIVSYGCGRKDNALVIPAKKEGVKLKKITSGAFSDSKITSITLPNLSETNKLTIANNAFIRNKVPGADGFIYKIANGVVDYSILSCYAGPTGGEIVIPQTKNGVDLKSIEASFTWMSYKKITIPSTVTSIGNSVFAKSNRNNVNLKTIVNKSNTSFDWYKITGSTLTNPGPFITGTVKHQSGNIDVIGG